LVDATPASAGHAAQVPEHSRDPAGQPPQRPAEHAPGHGVRVGAYTQRLEASQIPWAVHATAVFPSQLAFGGDEHPAQESGSPQRSTGAPHRSPHPSDVHDGGGVHCAPSHRVPAQSRSATQARPFAHGLQDPPQSVSLSS